MKDEPAFPINWPGHNIGGGGEGLSINGLTKREYFAAMAMQGMVSYMADWNVLHPGQVAEKAIVYADVLIRELEKK